MTKPIYIAAYHQSKFGKLFDMTVPDIVANAVNGACGEIGVEASAIDVGSIGATCNFALNQQGLLRAESFGRGKRAVLRAVEQLGYVQIDNRFAHTSFEFIN